jgi:pyruvate ferredoxin oxidoreductase delta subunit
MKDLPTWKEIHLGCVVPESGGAVKFKTGDWRSFYPKTDEDKCIACGVCWVFCPDNSRKLAPRQHKNTGALQDQYYDFNFGYCKGCGICAAECPSGAIVMIEEGAK